MGLKLSAFVLATVVLARADLSQTATLGDGYNLNLDSGKLITGAPASGETYDITWSGGSIFGVGKAQIVNVGIRTAGQFDLITESDVKLRIAAGSARSIPPANLVAGDVFYTLTNAGNASKLFVVRNASGIMSLNFVTYQSAAVGAPKITAVLNNSSRVPSSAPNYGIAPSSLFIVQGTGLSDPGDPVLQSSASPGLLLTLNGASIQVTVAGVTTHAPIYYTSPTQIAAVLPANTPTGSGTLVAAYKGVVSAPFNITVVRSAVGINVYGDNIGVATDAITGAVLTLTNSGSPGQTVVIWATGLGPDPSDSDTTYSSSPHAVSTNLQILFGLVPAKILYQGSSGYPGVNQINVVIPDNAPTGCFVSLAAVIDNTTVSNVATIPIRKGGGDCVDEATGLKGSQFSPGVPTTYHGASIGLLLDNAPDSKGVRTIQYGASANFSKYTGTSYKPGYPVSPGSCIVYYYQPAGEIPSVSGLDAGTITVTGPNSLNVSLPIVLGIKGDYNATLPTIPQSGGVYTWIGSGGADVGSFTSTLNLSPLLNWTNSSAAGSVERGNGLKVTWTGGNPGSYVFIEGATGGGVNAVRYSCVEHVEAGQFTVPSYILRALPASNGSTVVANLIFFPFTAGGLDISGGLTYIGYTMTTSASAGK